VSNGYRVFNPIGLVLLVLMIGLVAVAGGIAASMAAFHYRSSAAGKAG